MPSATDHESTLSRIATLAAQAMAQPDIPAALTPILAEIARLAGPRSGDTPEPSDIPQTENQSL